MWDLCLKFEEHRHRHTHKTHSNNVEHRYLWLDNIYITITQILYVQSIDNKTNTHISHVSIRFWAAICDWIATASPHPAPFPVTFNVCTASRSEYRSGLHTAHSQIHKGKGHDWSLLSISVCSFRNGKWRGFHVVLKTNVFRRHNRWNNIDAIGCKGGCTQMVEQYCPPEVLWRGSGELCNLPWPHHRVTFKRRWVLFL